MIAAIFLVATVSTPLRIAEVDVCELNHTIDSDGDTRFTQVILWRWCPQWPMDAKHHVAEYFMVDSDVRIDRKHGRHRVVWRDKLGQAYEVRAVTYRETTTAYDPEAWDRHEWPMDKRRPYFQKR